MTVDNDQAGHLERCACGGTQPSHPHEEAMEAILKTRAWYLHWTTYLRLNFVRGSGLDLTAYSDGYCADKSDDGRSESGTVFALGGAAVSPAHRRVLSCPQQRQSTSPWVNG